MYSTNLAQLSSDLRDIGLDRPAVIVDLDAVDHNVLTLKMHADPDLSWRLVAKSLPSAPLLEYLKQALSVKNLMVFSEPMLADLLPDNTADLLLGRPMSVCAARRILTAYQNAANQVQWLVDSVDRVSDYNQLAVDLMTTLRVNLEIDVGLHRGGFSVSDIPELHRAMAEASHLKLSGLMGYEPHLSKLPRPLSSRSKKRFLTTYSTFRAWATTLTPDLCLNTGGSSTFQNYSLADDVNDLSFGSVLVLPSDFDASSKLGFIPAAFVATPILKVMQRNSWPGLELLTPFRRRATDIAIQGGYYMAHPKHPPGFAYSGIFGRSTNQELWTGPQLSTPAVGDIALLRPTQSEFVLGSLGPILAYRRGQAVMEWTTLDH